MPHGDISTKTAARVSQPAGCADGLQLASLLGKDLNQRSQLGSLRSEHSDD